MPIYPLPEQETERQEKLRSYEILDGLPDESYDRIVRLAANLFEAPIAAISLIEDDRQWFKAQIGIKSSFLERGSSFCAHAICQDDVFVIEDATQDPRFAENPFVNGKQGLRFYAGAPLRTGSGLNLGTLAVLDTKPRSVSDKEKHSLADMAAMVIEAMDMQLLINRADAAERRFLDAMESVPNGFVLYDKDDRLVICNKRYREIYADSADYIVPGATFEEIIRKGVENGQYPDAVGNEEAWIAERLEMHRNPGDHPIEQHLPGDRWLRVQERRTSEGGMVGFRVDITALKRQERELARLAWTDSLTGAMNRYRFIELAEKEINRTNRHGKDLSLLLLDADHFKQINDRNGHAAGDAVLKELVERCRKVLRSHDMIGRIGGEEFAILLPEVGVSGAAKTAEKVRSAIADLPFACEGQLLRVTISIGVATYAHDDDLAGLMRRADTALYRAKGAGRDRFIVSAA